MLGSTSEVIWRARTAQVSRYAKRERIRYLIGWTDRLLEELEQLNLRGVERVPVDTRRSFARLVAQIPWESDSSVRVHHKVMAMMDVLFQLQQGLFLAKHRFEASLQDGCPG